MTPTHDLEDRLFRTASNAVLLEGVCVLFLPFW